MRRELIFDSMLWHVVKLGKMWQFFLQDRMLRLVVNAKGLYRVDWFVVKTWVVITGLIGNGVLCGSMMRL